MKILWVKTDFLHPTTRGGQIRTLEMLRELHRRHEVHYVAFDDPSNPEGIARAPEYSSFFYPIAHTTTPKDSPRFALELLKGVTASLPVSGFRYRSEAMRMKIVELERQHQFDAKVCDFLFPSVNIPNMRDWTLFQHNVESLIWERHAKAGRTVAHRAYFAGQARKMLQWERAVCRTAASVIAVSDVDADLMKQRFGVESIGAVPTGVDTGYFARPERVTQTHDLVFVGSMDWMPNIDGMRWFMAEVMPLIKAKRPDLRLAIVGRNPPATFAAEARAQAAEVTGTVPDVRPYLWNAALSIVPLRVGGGTRLKIFEAMAAGTPVVSTAVGAEGLPAEQGRNIQMADSAEDFAAACLLLLEDRVKRDALAASALRMVLDRFSWSQVTTQFERAMTTSRAPAVPVS